MSDAEHAPAASEAVDPPREDPAAEAAHLAAAARAGLERLARLGHRRTARPAGAASAAPAAARPDPAPAVAATPAPAQPTPAPRPPTPAAAPPAPAARAQAPHPDPGEAPRPGGATGGGAAGRASAPESAPAGPAGGNAAGAARPPMLDEARLAALAESLSPAAAAAFRERVERVAAQAAAARDLEELREGVASCTACRLCEARTKTVFADGSAAARVMFVGEGPGADEDASGVPFVGAAGRMLTDIIEKGMRLDRANDVYIANVVKCRPPGNRDPSPHEKAICAPWLARQIEFVDPAVLVPLGKHAAQALLAREDSLGRLRGAVHAVGGRRVVATYHPSWLLRQTDAERPAAKRKVWEDIRRAMTELGLPGA